VTLGEYEMVISRSYQDYFGIPPSELGSAQVLLSFDILKMLFDTDK